MFENIDILDFPEAKCIPVKEDELLRNSGFLPSASRVMDGSIPGHLSTKTEYGCYKVEWKVNVNIILYQQTQLSYYALLRP